MCEHFKNELLVWDILLQVYFVFFEATLMISEKKKP